MVEQGRIPAKGQIHIIRSDDFGDIATELAERIWQGCDDDVLEAMKQDEEEFARMGVPVEIAARLVHYGFDCAVYEMLRAQCEGRIQFRELEKPKE